MKKYIVLSIVFFASILGSWLLPIDELFKGIFATPALLSLIAALYQLLRDDALHRKNLELQQQQHLFNIGAMSHMANVVFDKHVQFCDHYIKELHSTLTTLFREGPTSSALTHARNFALIKQEYAAWITDDISNQLIPFEQALRNLGAAKEYINTTENAEGYEKERHEFIRKAYNEFNKILTIDGNQPDEQVAIEIIIKNIREILDIENLTQLRKSLVTQAKKSLEDLR